MSYETVNSLRTSSIIRIEGAGSTTIELANLAFNEIETVNSAAIKSMFWSTNGSIVIARGEETLSTLYSNGTFIFPDLRYSMANNSTQPIIVTINSGGTIFLEVTKDTEYDPALEGDLI
jgi:hypothetical protein